MGSAISGFAEDIGLGDINKVNPLSPENVLGEVGQTIADPLDLFGFRAESTADEINRILEQSAAEGIALNEAQLAEIESLTQPFRDVALDTALPTLKSLAFGGEIDYQPSALYQTQLEQGRTGILEGQAAGSGVKSSGTLERLSDLASGLASEDLSRYEQANAGLLETGRTAEQSLSNAGTQLSGNISSLLSGLGTGQAATAQNLAQQQIAAGQTVGSGLQGLSQLLAQR